MPRKQRHHPTSDCGTEGESEGETNPEVEGNLADHYQGKVRANQELLKTSSHQPVVLPRGDGAMHIE